MNSLEDALRNQTSFTKARNPRECAFGKWYYSYACKDLRLSLLIHRFEVPHTEIHHLADNLLGMMENGQVKRALGIFEQTKQTTLAELLNLFDNTIALVGDLQRRIVIVVEYEDVFCALGADKVRDILSVSLDRLKPSVGMGQDMVSAMIILDDNNAVPLLNIQSFFDQWQLASAETKPVELSEMFNLMPNSG